MRLKKFIMGSASENCYVIDNSTSALVIDPGIASEDVVSYLNDNKLNLDGILITHGHYDHIGGIDFLVARYGCPVYGNDYLKKLLKDPRENLSYYHSPLVIESDIIVAKDDMQIGAWETKWFHLPGHSPDSCMIYLPKLKIMFTGDVLFKDSIGRFDFPNSSIPDTKKTIEKIKQMDFDCRIYPGHGLPSTLKEEQENNYYLK